MRIRNVLSAIAGLSVAGLFVIPPAPALSPPVAGSIALGDTRYFQFWYRNPAGGGAGFNLSDSLRATFCP